MGLEYVWLYSHGEIKKCKVVYTFNGEGHECIYYEKEKSDGLVLDRVDSIISDCSMFKDACLRYFGDKLFISEELAHEYIDAVKRYAEKWCLESDIEHNKGSISRCEQHIREYQDKIQESQQKLDKIIASLC